MSSRRFTGFITRLGTLMLVFVGASTSFALDEALIAAQHISTRSPLLWTEIGLLLAVLALAIASRFKVENGQQRGLGMPRGSVRAILALLAVGSFINVLVFGAPHLGDAYSATIAAFGTLTGSIIGFYFGNRTATPLTENGTKAQSDPNSPNE